MNLRILVVLFLFCFLGNVENSFAQKAQNYSYRVASTLWEESLGNHRAVLQISRSEEAVALNYYWRRPDKDVDKRNMLIVNAETGDTISNIHRIELNNEHCQLLFGPVSKGIYYFYYLPYKVQNGYGGYGQNYIPQEKEPAGSWLDKVVHQKKHAEARVLQVESRTAFDSFYPMEVAAIAKETETYLAKHPASLFLFPEDRKNTIRMRNKIPVKWLNEKQGKEFIGEAAPNEYYTFQIGLWAATGNVNKVTYKASALQCGAESIPATALTCFNVEGVDPYGKAFKKELNVLKGEVRPLWFGVDIQGVQKPGVYKGTVTITDESGKQGVVPLNIRIGGMPLADRGDSELWRQSRLRWLNSTLGIADTPTQPYTSMTVDKNRIGCLGRIVTVDESTGLPAQITSWNTDVLESPVRFIIKTAEGNKNLKAIPQLTEHTAGHVSGSWMAEDADLKIVCREVMEFDGWLNYIYTITPKKRIEVKDIRLEIPVRNEVGSSMMGMGLPGQETPLQYDGKWDAPEKTVDHFGVSIATSKEQQWLWPFDSFWIGNAHAGIHCEFRGSSYSGPLLNLYRPAYPHSWFNGGKGGFSVRKEAMCTKAVAYSGERVLEEGKPITFDFAMIITPVKPLNMKSQFTDRYYHNGPVPAPKEEDMKAGVRIINVHQGNSNNPFINYPFLTVDEMKKFTSEWHQRGCKVKMYYTLRELSNATSELWAIRSLEHEILRGGSGGGFPWLREHLVTDYTPQWYEHFNYTNKEGIIADASILTAESDSRWYNYYIEGLAWMVHNLDIDGIYLDDVSFDRRILKRMRRAMESVKPDCLIDLHSNTGFSHGPATQYTEFFPYVDKLWFGESFLYNKMTPTNWLVESSGIPFGLSGDMLFRGGNAWLGMQYGMTVRYPWYTEGVNCDPRAVWKVWDDFGIADATMLGFWERNPAVRAMKESNNSENSKVIGTTTDEDVVKVTAFRKDGKVLLSVGNYSDEEKTVHLVFDWAQLGLDRQRIKLVAPEVKGFQSAAYWSVDSPITIKSRKGWLIYMVSQ